MKLDTDEEKWAFIVDVIARIRTMSTTELAALRRVSGLPLSEKQQYALQITARGASPEDLADLISVVVEEYGKAVTAQGKCVVVLPPDAEFVE